MTVESFRHKFPSGNWPATRYTEVLSTEKRNGVLIHPHRLLDGAKAPDAVALLRKTMAVQPDGSVVVIQVGYSTNLARLLDSPSDEVSSLNGRDLVKRKVLLLSVMAGNFGDSQIDGKPLAKGSIEFNLVTDVPSAQKLFSRWPTPIVASGFEIGLAMLYPATSIERDFSYVKDHPIVETYRRFAEDEKMPWPHDHPTFDLTSVLYAVRPDRNYFALSNPGRITVLDDGSSRFDEAPDGAHRFLIMNEDQKARTLEAMVMLVSQPPKR
jgi:inosine-uridine nucleoside N-ribohydrolase